MEQQNTEKVAIFVSQPKNALSCTTGSSHLIFEYCSNKRIELKEEKKNEWKSNE